MSRLAIHVRPPRPRALRAYEGRRPWVGAGFLPGMYMFAPGWPRGQGIEGSGVYEQGAATVGGTWLLETGIPGRAVRRSRGHAVFPISFSDELQGRNGTGANAYAAAVRDSQICHTTVADRFNLAARHFNFSIRVDRAVFAESTKHVVL